MLNNYLIYFYQPSKESGIPNLIPQGRSVLGILTIIGLIKAICHIIDAVTDPLIASCSDKSRHPDGRRIPLMKKPFIRRLHPEVRGMFEALALHMAFPMRTVFSNLGLFSDLLTRLMPKLNAAAGEMLGTGCTFKNISTNDDGTCRAQAFLRCINDADFEKDLDTLRKMAECHGVRIVLRDEDNEYYKPTSLDSRGYQYVKETAQAVFPYAAVAPFILPAGTDARRFTGLSDAVIRFAPIDIDDQQYASVHGENENISIDKLSIAVDFYKQLLRNYA